MMMNVFIIAMSVAVIVQLGILAALYLNVKQTSARMEALVTDFHRRASPVLDSAGAILSDSQGKLRVVTDNLVATTSSIRYQVAQMEDTLGDALDRTRVNIIRVDQMVARSLDRVEETTELLQGSIIGPVRQLAGLVAGLSVGLQTLFRRRGAPGGPQSVGVPQDEEMFI